MVKRIILASFMLLSVPLWATAATVTLPKTGQTLCYDANGTIDCIGTGQDGETQIGATWPNPRFTDNLNGTVTDHLTGLTWLQDPACQALNPPPAGTLPGGRNWASALTAVKTLTNGQCGLTDGSGVGTWRLPNVSELDSLVDLSRFYPPLPADNHFGNFPPNPVYWTSTITGDYFPAINAIGEDMYTGTIQGDDKTNLKYVWPVKGDSTTLARTGQNTCWDPSDLSASGTVVPCNGSGTDGDLQKGVPLPSPRFFDNVNGTITDSLTGLIWPKYVGCFGNISSQGQGIRAAKALADGACDLVDGSLPGDWRLPNRKEMRSLVDYGRAWLYDFSGAPGHGWYWTSDSFPVVPNTSRKWVVKSQGLAWLDNELLTFEQLPPYYMLPVRDQTSPSGPVVIRAADLTRTYDGFPKLVTVTTTPAGMAVTVTYDGSATPPTNAGSYPVVATLNDPIYHGSASGTLEIAKASASVTLGSLSQVYDGAPKKVTATTFPVGRDVTFSYTPANPISVGSYAVLATVFDDNYSGTASGSLTVTKRTPSVTWSTPAAVAPGTALSATQLNATGSVPGSFVYTPALGAVLPSGTQTLSAIFTPTDTTNYTNASASVLLTVAPTYFTVTFVPGSGTLTGAASQSVASGASTSAVTAVPATGYHFVQWTGPGGFTSTSNPLTVADVSADQTLTAAYAVDTFRVTGSAPGGNGSISCTSLVDYGATCICTVTPSAGYHVITLTDNGADRMSALYGGIFTIAGVTADHQVSATFARANGILNPAAGKTSPDIGDALIAFKMYLKMTTCTAADLARADIAPLGSDGKPFGDGKLDIYDVIGILRMLIGL